MLSTAFILAFCVQPAFATPTFTPSLALLQTEDSPMAALPPETPTQADLPGLFAQMIKAFKEGNWPLAFGAMSLVLFLLIGAINGFLKQLTSVTDEMRKKVLPWMLAIAMCLDVFGLSLIGGLGWLNSIVLGWLTGGGAIAFWELIATRLVPWLISLFQKKAAEPPAPPQG